MTLSSSGSAAISEIVQSGAAFPVCLPVMSPRPASRFERHPVLTLAPIVALLLLAIDLGGTRVYAIFHPDFYREHSVFRVKSDIYHHGFKPNVSADRDYWGPLVSSYRIDSLGLRDRAVRDVPL